MRWCFNQIILNQILHPKFSSMNLKSPPLKINLHVSKQCKIVIGIGRQELSDKTYGALQVPSHWAILHASQVSSFSVSLCCIYLSLFITALWNDILFYMYIWKLEKTMKEAKKGV